MIMKTAFDYKLQEKDVYCIGLYDIDGMAIVSFDEENLLCRHRWKYV
jgi:hypothetical protein